VNSCTELILITPSSSVTMPQLKKKRKKKEKEKGGLW
jgi:hypothetical protein